jgi:hypothetical protein
MLAIALLTVQLNSLNLSKNLINSITAHTDIPSLDQFPKSHQVTYNYYKGVITFLAEDYEIVGYIPILV